MTWHDHRVNGAVHSVMRGFECFIMRSFYNLNTLNGLFLSFFFLLRFHFFLWSDIVQNTSTVLSSFLRSKKIVPLSSYQKGQELNPHHRSTRQALDCDDDDAPTFSTVWFWYRLTFRKIRLSEQWKRWEMRVEWCIFKKSWILQLN